MEDITEETIKYTKKIDTVEIQVCPEFTDKDKLTKLAKTLKEIRKKIFDIYGVPLPPIKITCCDTTFPSPEIQIRVFIIGYCIQEINKQVQEAEISDIIYNCIKHNLPRFITSSCIEKIYKEVEKENPMLMTTLKSFTNSYAAVRRVLIELVANYIPINNIPLIFESILETYAKYDINNRNYWYLISEARLALAPTFITELLDSKREFLFFDVSKNISEYLRDTEYEVFKQDFLEPFKEEIGKILKDNLMTVFVLDMPFQQVQSYSYHLKTFFPDLKIISKTEVEKANHFSPFTLKSIKTIDIALPKKEDPVENKTVEKKTSWIQRKLNQFRKKK